MEAVKNPVLPAEPMAATWAFGSFNSRLIISWFDSTLPFRCEASRISTLSLFMYR